MECFAAYLSHADAEIGRVLDFIEHDLGELDDTVVVLLSDNGASAEGGQLGSINDARMWNGMPAGRRELADRIDELGGPTAHNNYPWGWTMAGNTPFKRWKREVHEGGVADPCIVSWPNGLAEVAGAVRRQYAHAIDVLPTLLDLIGVEPPTEIDGVAQSPIEGTSFAAVVRSPDAPAARTTQYFEMLGSRAIYHDGWKAVTFKPLGRLYDDGIDPDAPFEDDRWELYHVATDFSECHDLAGDEPDRLAAMQARWWDEARAHQVLPLDNRPLAALLAPRPSRAAHPRDRYVYRQGAAPVPETIAVNVRNRPHSITADVEVPDGVVPNGVLLAQGSVLGGWSLYLVDGVLHYVHNLTGREISRAVAGRPIGAGRHQLGFAFERSADFAGTGQLYLDGEPAGSVDIALFTPARFSITGSGLTCGYEVGPAISPDYTAPHRFTGTIHRAVVDVTGAPYRDVAAELDAILSEQ
jgi:arylsulfatase